MAMTEKPLSECVRYFQKYLQYAEEFWEQTALSNSSPIKRVTLVGAKNDDENPEQLSLNDRDHLRTTFDAMVNFGIPVHPDFEIEIANIRPEYGGQDILKRTAETDLLVYCFVHNPDPAKKVAVPFHTNPSLHRDFLISAHHFDRNVWHDSADRMQAKLLSVIIGPFSSYMNDHIAEINHRHFLRVADSRFEKLNNYDGHHLHTLLKRKDFHLTA